MIVATLVSSLRRTRRRCGPRYGQAMRTTLRDLPRFDVALALVMAALKLATLVAGIQPSAGALSYVLVPFWTLPFAWRRRAPLAVALIVSSTSIVEVVAVGYRDSVIALAAFVLVPYSLGGYASKAWRMAAGLAAMGLAGAVSDAHQPLPHSLTGWEKHIAGDVTLMLVPFCVGLALRAQRKRTETLEALTRQLEHEREERARAAVAEERTRIARELHDEVAHAMSVIAVQADAAEGALAHDPALVARPLVAIRDTAREALSDMRRVLGALRADEAAELAPEPGLARVGALLEQARAAGLDVELRVEGEPVPLPPPLDLAAYRVVQEGLTNVRKHARAQHVEVVLRYDASAIGVEVADDGLGAVGGGGGSGRGLVGIRERVALLGGEFVAGPRPRGFALRVRLPLA
jgi:signal transduction histidine kinase